MRPPVAELQRREVTESWRITAMKPARRRKGSCERVKLVKELPGKPGQSRVTARVGLCREVVSNLKHSRKQVLEQWWWGNQTAVSYESNGVKHMS